MFWGTFAVYPSRRIGCRLHMPPGKHGRELMVRHRSRFQKARLMRLKLESLLAAGCCRLLVRNAVPLFCQDHQHQPIPNVFAGGKTKPWNHDGMSNCPSVRANRGFAFFVRVGQYIFSLATVNCTKPVLRWSNANPNGQTKRKYSNDIL